MSNVNFDVPPFLFTGTQSTKIENVEATELLPCYACSAHLSPWSYSESIYPCCELLAYATDELLTLNLNTDMLHYKDHRSYCAVHQAILA